MFKIILYISFLRNNPCLFQFVVHVFSSKIFDPANPITDVDPYDPTSGSGRVTLMRCCSRSMVSMVQSWAGRFDARLLGFHIPRLMIQSYAILIRGPCFFKVLSENVEGTKNCNIDGQWRWMRLCPKWFPFSIESCCAGNLRPLVLPEAIHKDPTHTTKMVLRLTVTVWVP